MKQIDLDKDTKEILNFIKMSSDFNFTVTYLSLQNSFENRVKGLLSKIFDQPIWFDSICLLNYDFFI